MEVGILSRWTYVHFIRNMFMLFRQNMNIFIVVHHNSNGQWSMSTVRRESQSRNKSIASSITALEISTSLSSSHLLSLFYHQPSNRQKNTSHPKIHSPSTAIAIHILDCKPMQILLKYCCIFLTLSSPYWLMETALQVLFLSSTSFRSLDFSTLWKIVVENIFR